MQLEPDAEPARYRLREMVRQYSRERLRAAGEEAEFVERHAACCSAPRRKLGAALAGTGDLRLMAEVDRDARQPAFGFRLGDGDRRQSRGRRLRIGSARHWYW